MFCFNVITNKNNFTFTASEINAFSFKNKMPVEQNVCIYICIFITTDGLILQLLL